MGKSNLWYAKSAYGRGEFIPRVIDEIQRDDLNFVPISLEDKIKQISSTLEDGNDLSLGHEAYDEEKDFLAAAYFTRALEKEETYEAYLGLAKSYQGALAYTKALEILEKMMSLYGEDEELINEAFSISDFILDYERASLYYKKQKSYEEEEMVQEEYYAYINELEDLVKSFGAYIKK
jgi:tetratricopeptide (TPR) repeat protein